MSYKLVSRRNAEKALYGVGFGIVCDVPMVILGDWITEKATRFDTDVGNELVAS